MFTRSAALCLAASLCMSAQDLKPREEQRSGTYRVEAGTHVLLTLKNTISSKSAHAGDKLYLKTAFPVIVNGRIVIPQGSYVTGTITEVKRAGRMLHGHSEMQVRFDSLTLPNGVTRDFKSDLGAVDGASKNTADTEHSKVKADGNGGHDAATIATTTATGAGIGTLAGAAAGHLGSGLGIGAGAGAAAGMATVLASRGPDAVLTEGSTLEMVTGRPLDFDESELADGAQLMRRPLSPDSARRPEPAQSNTDDNEGGFKRAHP